MIQGAVLGAICALLLQPPAAAGDPAGGRAGPAGNSQQTESRLETLEAATLDLARRLEASLAAAAEERAKRLDLERRLAVADSIHAYLETLLTESREEGTDLAARLEGLPDLGGYYDFEYFNDDRKGSPGEFRQHRLAILLSQERGAFRVHGEVEFEYGAHFEGDGEEIEVARGEVILEQAWAEYDATRFLALRAGIVFTPGYWNVNHYPNVVLPTRKPLMVSAVYPESFVGVMAWGRVHPSDVVGLTYQAYVGNGDSPSFAKDDDNENKAIGGRLVLHLPGWRPSDVVDVAVSGYDDTPSGSGETRVWGADAEFRTGRLEVLSEFAKRTGDARRRGLYVQPSFRLSGALAVFYRYDHLETETGAWTEQNTLGVNVRPEGHVSLKVEGYRSSHSNRGEYNALAASVAIAY